MSFGGRQSQRRHTIHGLGEREAEIGSARRSFLKGRDEMRAIDNQTNIGTVSKGMLKGGGGGGGGGGKGGEKGLRHGVERIWASPITQKPELI